MDKEAQRIVTEGHPSAVFNVVLNNHGDHATRANGAETGGVDKRHSRPVIFWFNSLNLPFGVAVGDEGSRLRTWRGAVGSFAAASAGVVLGKRFVVWRTRYYSRERRFQPTIPLLFGVGFPDFLAVHHIFLCVIMWQLTQRTCRFSGLLLKWSRSLWCIPRFSRDPHRPQISFAIPRRYWRTLFPPFQR